MTKDKTIALLARRNLKLEEKLEELKRRIGSVNTMFVAIGGPLNDSKLQFTPQQLVFINSAHMTLLGEI